jgi:hypothetical protein
MINKEDLNKLAEAEGEVKGVVFQTDAKYILEKEGETGLKKIEDKIKELGFPIDYKSGAMDSYPIGLRIVSLLLIKEVFSWPDSEIRNMGYVAPKTSFIVKLLMKFFISMEKFVKKIPTFWNQHYTRGKLEVINFDNEKKELSLRLTEIEIHPTFFVYLEGYFEKMLQFLEKTSKAKMKEAVYEGKPCHECLIKWE